MNLDHIHTEENRMDTNIEKHETKENLMDARKHYVDSLEEDKLDLDP